MKRDNYLIDRIACPENLRLAFWKAQRNHSIKEDIEEYRRHLDVNLIALRNEILCGEVNVGDYHYFTIHDPKERLICAATFRERVLHHALMNICHDNFERYQIFDSYACRVGKGTYAALDRAKSFHRRYNWFLKLDVRKYFQNIDHEALKDLLRHRFKEEKLLSIFNQIIDSYNSQLSTFNFQQKGLPIGNLTSQYFANHYLASADRYVTEQLRVPAYVRYMDDMALWSNSKAELLSLGKNFETYIAEHLKLELKPFCLNAVDRGLPFLGYLLFPGRTRLGAAGKKRFSVKIEDYTVKLQQGYWSQMEYQQHVLPLISFVRYADTLRFRRDVSKRKKNVEYSV